MINGDDLKPVKAVGNTTCCMNFLAMQVIRFLMIVTLSGFVGCYLYIYMPLSLIQFHFWALFLFLIAEINLFIGSGKELVRQKLEILWLEKPDIKVFKNTTW